MAGSATEAPSPHSHKSYFWTALLPAPLIHSHGEQTGHGLPRSPVSNCGIAEVEIQTCFLFVTEAQIFYIFNEVTIATRRDQFSQVHECISLSL